MKMRILSASMILAAFLATSAQAQPRGGSNNVRGILGFNHGALNIGADYENRVDNTFGFGGYFHLSTEKKNDTIAKNQTISFGAIAPAHLLDDNRFDVFLAPGAAITMVKGINGASDETVIGPVLKTGVLYKASRTVHVGLQTLFLSNWFSEKAASNLTYADLAVGMTF